METTFPTILEIKRRFEIGQKFFRISGSSKIFLISGVRIASLKLSGNIAVDSDTAGGGIRTQGGILSWSILSWSIMYGTSLIYLGKTQFKKSER